MTKTAIITGAARGIGLTTAKLFLTDDWNVALVDRDSEELEDATAHLKRVLALSLDISEPDQVEKMISKTLNKFGQIGALVNNAGVADFTTIEDTSFNRWREIMATNLDGIFLCVQAAVPS